MKKYLAPLALLIILILSTDARAHLFLTYDKDYADKRLEDYVAQYNKTHLSLKTAKAQLKIHFPKAKDQAYIDGYVRYLDKSVYHTTLLLIDGKLEFVTNGKAIATVSHVDPVARIVKINGLEVSIKEKSSIINVHRSILHAIEARHTAGLLNHLFPLAHARNKDWKMIEAISLFAMVPLAIDLQRMTFERSLKDLSDRTCKEAQLNVAKKYPYQSHWLVGLRQSLLTKARKNQTCDYWAQNEIRKGVALPNERLRLLCTLGRKAMSCTARSPETPFGLKPNRPYPVKLRSPAKAN